jgi:DNA-binding transcriptional LysR family regulator
MDIHWFRDLAHLGQTGNFSQAAGMSHISQPAFSRRIKSLEAWVGVELVDRSKQPVRLTPAGTQMLEAGQQALLRIESERGQILEANSLPDKYVVTFGTQHSIGWRFYPTWLHAFEENYGPILSRLRADDLPNCIRDLKEGSVDFVIAYASPNSLEAETAVEFGPDARDIQSLVIGRDQLVPVCKKGADGQPLFSFEDRNIEVPFLQFGAGASISRHLDPLLATAELQGRLKTIYENSMAGALRIRARDGDGVAWLPKSLVSSDLERELLVRTGKPTWEVDLEVRLYRKRAYSNHNTRSIWSFLAVRESVPLQPSLL